MYEIKLKCGYPETDQVSEGSICRIASVMLLLSLL